MPSETSEPRHPAFGRDVFRMLQELGLVPGPPHIVISVDIRIRHDEFVTMSVEMAVPEEMMTALLPEMTALNVTDLSYLHESDEDDLPDEDDDALPD